MARFSGSLAYVFAARRTVGHLESRRHAELRSAGTSGSAAGETPTVNAVYLYRGRSRTSGIALANTAAQLLQLTLQGAQRQIVIPAKLILAQSLESGRFRGVRRLRVIFPGQKRAHSGYSETT